MELKDFERYLELKKITNEKLSDIGLSSANPSKEETEYYKLKHELEQFVFDNQSNQEKIICKLKTSLNTWKYDINLGKANEALNEIKVIKEIMNLLDIYDWKQHHSEYSTVVNEKMVNEVAVWRQNGEGRIKNHQIWIVSEKIK